MDRIIIRGARQHNLKNISLELPKNKLVVITGLSGSGKSSLAFDTLYAEGQRRYVESLSAYARQFLELMEKPDVDLIEGLSPAIAIEQRNPSHNPRSTVATTTEIYDYLRLLFARIGRPHCPKCKRPVKKQSPQAITQEALNLFPGQPVSIWSPLVMGRTGTYEELFNRLKRSGYVKVRVDGKISDLDSAPKLSRYAKHVIELFIDTVAAAKEEKDRLFESIETALKESRGLVRIEPSKKAAKGVLMSEHHACPECGLSLPELEPRLFSFNSPYGACPSCDGIGQKTEVDPDLVIPDPSLSIQDGAIVAWDDPVTTRTNRWKKSWSGYYAEILETICRQHGINPRTPWSSLPQKQKEIILYGGGHYRPHWAKNDQEFEGIIPNLERRYKETESEFVKSSITERFMRKRECPDCHGARLKPEALAVLVGGKNIREVTTLSISQAYAFVQNLNLNATEKAIAKMILKEILSRLEFLTNVGLDYLTLDRTSETLAGGEAQRIHLATQIGSGLSGVLYVLDEPSIGLHPRDNTRLLTTLKRLRDIGNTLIVVEHDEETMLNADWIIDLGPGAGIHGGKIIAQGTPKQILASKDSLTGAYLRGDKKTLQKRALRSPSAKQFISILGAKQFNLKNIDVKIPLGLFVSVTGVSGSGKSTLVHEILYKALAQKFYASKDAPGAYRAITGIENIDKVIVVDQSPIGRTPRSNPATYTGLWSPIREIFAQLPQARARGYKPGRFSFNVKGGRCENCSGDGSLQISMQFLPDVYVPCEECRGARFNEETLSIRYKGKNIAEVLAMSVEGARIFFENHPLLSRILKTIEDVGLGYITLGQAATTLSGGEAQRVKLAAELGRRDTGKTLYILDEPTTGLHFADVDKLINVLHRLVDHGNTVLVIEHNLDVIRNSDWIIDLGPEGGAGGGRLMAEGTPQEIAKNPHSHTGRYLEINPATCYTNSK